MRGFRTLVGLLTAITLFAFGISANAQTAELQSRRDRLEKEIAILDGQLKTNATLSANALTRLALVQSKVTSRQALIRESDREIASLNANIADNRRQIGAAQAQLDTMTAYYSRLVRSAYKNRDARIWYMYILASDNLGQASRRFSFFRNLSSEMNKQAAAIKDKKAELEEKTALLVTMQKEAEVLREQRQKELDGLKNEESEAKQLTTKLNREKTKYQNELNQKRKQSQALEAEIKKAISAAVNGKKSSTEIDYTLASEFVANKGKLPWPADGVVVTRFGKQYHPVFKSLQLPDNNGISIAVAANAEVKAVFDGKVSQIKIFPGYHQCILVQHGNYFTLYSKMKEVRVKAGDKVTTGQTLGTVDTINGETVFHFEIWNEKTVPQNPESWLRPR